MDTLTSSSAVAQKLRCRVGQMDRLHVHVTTMAVDFSSPFLAGDGRDLGVAQLGWLYMYKSRRVPEKPTVLAGNLKHTDTMPFK